MGSRRLSVMHSVAELGRCVSEGAVRQDGRAIARVFSLHSSSVRRVMATVADPSVPVVHALLYASRVPSGWSDVCELYVRCGALLFWPKLAFTQAC